MSQTLRTMLSPGAGGRTRTGTGLAAPRIFIPLRLSPPPFRRSWSGLSLHPGACPL